MSSALMHPFNETIDKIKELCVEWFESRIDLSSIQIRQSDLPEISDFSLPCFNFAKSLKKSPPLIAEEIANLLSENNAKVPEIYDIKAIKGFVNFRVSTSFLVSALETSLSSQFPIESRLSGLCFTVEHTSSNPNGPMHIGNFRGSVIGDVFARILKKMGAKVLRRSYINDLGKQMSQAAFGFLLLQDSSLLPSSVNGKFLGRVYACMTNLRNIEDIVLQMGLDSEEEKKRLLAILNSESILSSSIFSEIERSDDLHNKLSKLREVEESLIAKTGELYTQLSSLVNNFRKKSHMSVNSSCLILMRSHLSPESFTGSNSDGIEKDLAHLYSNFSSLPCPVSKEEHPIHVIARIGVAGHSQTLSLFNISHDCYDYESKYEWNGLVSYCVKALEKLGLARIEEGALVFQSDEAIMASDYSPGIENIKGDVPNTILITKSGDSLYLTRDIAYSPAKFYSSCRIPLPDDTSILSLLTDTVSLKGLPVHDVSKVFSVIGQDQLLSQLQLRIALAALGKPDFAKSLQHFSYGIVHLKDMKMSGRLLQYVTPSDVLSITKDRVIDVLKAGNSDFSSSDFSAVVEKVARASVKIGILKQIPNKELTYDAQESTDIRGDSAPFLLYSFVRANSILEKNSSLFEVELDPTVLTHSSERDLLIHLNMFDTVLYNSYLRSRPDSLVNYAFKLAKIFNQFYEKCRIAGIDNLMVARARLHLVSLYHTFMKLHIADCLGIDFLEKM